LTSITIIGLGPGDPGLLSKAAWDLLSIAPELWLRTREHPTVAALPDTLTLHSFDPVYARSDDFAAVYSEIAAEIVRLGRRPEGVIYAVPGDPAIGEATTGLIRELAAAEGIPVRIIHGVSFLEPACLALGLDPLAEDGLQIVDAMIVAARHAPPFDTSRPALLAQCYSRALASDVKLTLMHSYGPEHPVTILRGVASGNSEFRIQNSELYALDRSPQFDHLTTLYLPPVGEWASYSRLQEVVARLRAPDGCPWDREQTLQSLRRDVMEEIFELVEALDADDDAALVEELGDAALLIAMLAQIAAEEERFRWPDVMTRINAKLIRRHPHVFGDLVVNGVEDVLANWAAIKDEEKAANGDEKLSPLASVPAALPALALARKYQSRLERAGIDPDLSAADPLALQLWDLAAEAKAAGSDAETALRELCRDVRSNS